MRQSNPIELVAAHYRRWGQQFGAVLFARTAGQGMTEYGLILVLIMVVCVAILGSVGHTVSSVWYDKLLDGDSPFK